MIVAEKLIAGMRDGQLDLHCVSVAVTQKCDGGLCLKGYGVLKVNQVGTIYLDFICLDTGDTSTLKAKGAHFNIPDDPFDKKQKLYFEATTLGGDKVFAEEFSLRINVLNRGAPYRIHIFFREVYFVDNDMDRKVSGSYLYFELLERPSIPPNKMNTTSSSYGEEFVSWDETKVQVDGAIVTIIDRKDKVVVRVVGEFVVDEIYQALLFYIGLSSGAIPQPYCLIQRVGNETVTHFKTVRIGLRGKSMPAPITDATFGDGFPACHYAILLSIIHVGRNNPLWVNSAYSQWQRVWHSFQSENNIAILTLGVAVEGLLNDVYIPELQRTSIDRDLEEAKIALIEELNKLGAREDHKKTLTASVGRWGNIHPAKALAMLVEKGLVLQSEKKAWRDLRNSAAHPVFNESNEASQLKERERISNTLTLFYRLVLNILEYNGAMYEFRSGSRPELLKRKFVRVLGQE